MTAVNGYVSTAELRARGGFDDIDTGTLEPLITVAARVVDAHCGRRFWADDEPTVRYYVAAHPGRLDVYDIADTDTITVETDDGTGTWTQWAATDWRAWPLNGIVDGIEGHPATILTAAGTARRFPLGPDPLVRITATYGWAAVPAAIGYVCGDLVRRALFAELGIQSEQTGSYQVAYDFVGMRALLSDSHRAMLAPYRKAGVA